MNWLFSIFLLCAVANANHFGFRRGFKTPRLPTAVSAETCSPSDQQATRACLDAYFTALSIDSSKTLPEYFSYLAQIDQIVVNYGMPGYDIYCNTEFELESCLGTCFSAACMGPSAFKAMYSLDDTESGEYATTFLMEQYTCQNKQVLKDNFDCMEQVVKDNINDMIECGIKMNEELGSATDVCVPLSDEIMCLDNIYKKCGNDVQKFACTAQTIEYTYKPGDLCTGKFPDCNAL